MAFSKTSSVLNKDMYEVTNITNAADFPNNSTDDKTNAVIFVNTINESTVSCDRTRIPDSYQQMDPIVLQAIKLLQLEREFQAYIEKKAKHPIVQNVELTLPPSRVKYTLERVTGIKPDTFRLPDLTYPMDQSTANKLLRRSIAAIVAFRGFENCTSNALHKFHMITQEVFMNIAKQLKIMETHYSPNDDVDIPHKFFFQMSKYQYSLSLHEYYYYDVVNYSKTILERCKALKEVYEELPAPPAIKKKKVCKTTDDVPQIHVPEGHQKTFEHCYHILNHLEEEDKRDYSAHLIENPPCKQQCAYHLALKEQFKMQKQMMLNRLTPGGGRLARRFIVNRTFPDRGSTAFPAASQTPAQAPAPAPAQISDTNSSTPKN